MFRTQTLCGAAAILLCLSLAPPAHTTPPRDTYVKEEFLLTQEEFALRIISQSAQPAEDALAAEEEALRFQIRALDAVQENYGEYVVKTGDVFRPLSEEDVEHLMGFFGMRVFLRNREVPEWPGLGGESQLRSIMKKAEAAAAALQEVDPLPSSGPVRYRAIVDAGIHAEEILRASLKKATEQNWAEYVARRGSLEAKIAEIAAAREELRRLRNETEARQAQ